MQRFLALFALLLVAGAAYGDMADGPSLARAPTYVTNSLTSNITLNSTSTFFTGPSVSVPNRGTWCVSGNVTAFDSAGAAAMIARLWDGTTVIASGVMNTNGANFSANISLAGCITNPAGNLRIDVKDGSSTSGTISFNLSTQSKDSTITAWRIR